MRLEFEKTTLGNGLDVILSEDHRLPLVAVNLWYHVGPVRETAGRSGFAHLFEHMMFQGSGHIEEGSYFRHLEGAGASLVNGTTDFDRTNYMEDVPANQLELALWLESDRMGFLLDRLDQRMLSNQQDVVRNERRQSIENAPYGLAQEQAFHLLFEPDHPYHGMVMGSHADIQAARLEDVREFFRRYYAPNNASLAIVGDFDPATARALVAKYFGSIPRGPALEPLRVRPARIEAERRAVVSDRVELPRVSLAWLTPAIFTPGDAEAEITAEILSGSKASRLFKALVYEQRIAQSVSADQESLTLASVFDVSATAKPGVTAERLERALDAELKALAASGPTAAELAAAQTSLRAQIVMSLEHLGGFTGVADRLNCYNHHLGDPGYLERDLARYAAVTAEGVRAFVAETLRREARVVVHAVPGEKRIPPEPPTPESQEIASRPVVSAEPWRLEAPGPAPSAPRPLPPARAFRLANGLQVYRVESHALPVISARLVLRAGSAGDPREHHGLAGFTAAMLDEGTPTRDALAIARDLDALGATLGLSTGTDGGFATLRVLKETLGPAMEIVAELVLAPTFPEAEIERVRVERLTALLQQRDSPFQIASRVLLASLYGADHPYGHPALGAEEGLRRITRSDVLGFYGRAFTPAGAALVLAGDLDEDEAHALAERAFGRWSGAAADAAALPAPAPMRERVLIVDKPGAPQTHLLFGQLCVPRADPDFERLDVMNSVLGGLFTSRINLNLRERNGWTYGATSAIGERRGQGPLYISTSVRTDATGDAIRETLREVDGLLAAPVSEAELAMAREMMARSLPAYFETTWNTAATVGDLHLFGLPPDYYETLPARVDALTPAEVHAATLRHVRREKMLVIAVGDRAAIEPQIHALALGEVGYRDADGQRLAVPS